MDKAEKTVVGLTIAILSFWVAVVGFAGFIIFKILQHFGIL